MRLEVLIGGVWVDASETTDPLLAIFDFPWRLVDASGLAVFERHPCES